MKFLKSIIADARSSSGHKTQAKKNAGLPGFTDSRSIASDHLGDSMVHDNPVQVAEYTASLSLQPPAQSSFKLSSTKFETRLVPPLVSQQFKENSENSSKIIDGQPKQIKAHQHPAVDEEDLVANSSIEASYTESDNSVNLEIKNSRHSENKPRLKRGGNNNSEENNTAINNPTFVQRDTPDPQSKPKQTPIPTSGRLAKSTIKEARLVNTNGMQVADDQNKTRLAPVLEYREPHEKLNENDPPDHQSAKMKILSTDESPKTAANNTVELELSSEQNRDFKQTAVAKVVEQSINQINRDEEKIPRSDTGARFIDQARLLNQQKTETINQTSDPVSAAEQQTRSFGLDTDNVAEVKQKPDQAGFNNAPQTHQRIADTDDRISDLDGSVIDEQTARPKVEHQLAYSEPVLINQPSALDTGSREVRIGQIDVFIHPDNSQPEARTERKPARHSIATESRSYLRRL